MKKIAHFGAFDHDSYGDVLFPKILRFLLPEFEITHVAPTGIPTPWSDACPIISMEEAVGRTEWDGIVVGGGDIIQSGEWSTKKWKRHARLPFAHLSGLWTGAAFLSAKLNIPVAWMAPGVPTPFEPWYADCVKLALACSDHLMVRDQASRRFLDPFAEKPIGVVPDFALVLSRMWRISTSSASHVVLALSRADTKTRSGDVNALIRKLRQ